MQVGAPTLQDRDSEVNAPHTSRLESEDKDFETKSQGGFQRWFSKIMGSTSGPSAPWCHSSFALLLLEYTWSSDLAQENFSKKLIFGLCTWTFSSLSQTGEGSRYTIQESHTRPKKLPRCCASTSFGYTCPSRIIPKRFFENIQINFLIDSFCQRGPPTENLGKMFGVSLVHHRPCPRKLFQKAYLWNVYLNLLRSESDRRRIQVHNSREPYKAQEDPKMLCINFIRIHLPIPS